jgi:hypothetical protein
MIRLRPLYFFFFLCSLFFVSCLDVFNMPSGSIQDDGEKALVNIFIGAEASGARSTVPNNSAIAGYQLTFTGGQHEPLNVVGTNHTQVFLGNRFWTITATAYRFGGIIGDSNDAVASGSINVVVTGGLVPGGFVPPIILRQEGTGIGGFHYEISVGTGVTGTLTLWNIEGISKITGFGNNGDLNLSLAAVDGLASGFFNLAAGRYIAEIRLINPQGYIAFLREVIEVWRSTVTTVDFTEPVFVNPNAILPNSEARLCEATSVIGGVSIGFGEGSGESESDPRTYICYPIDITNVPIDLLFDYDSLFSTFSWVVNTGGSPDGVYPNTEMPSVPINFSIE